MTLEFFNFNSHARVGRDAVYIVNFRLYFISTHTPAWGATNYNEFKKGYTEFQLTRPRGARPSFIIYIFIIIRFQLTRPRGARPGDVVAVEHTDKFQLTRPRGARR